MENWRERFNAEMRRGHEEYSDIIEQLCSYGLPTFFTQTGGMHAALEVQLETGDHLLITDSCDGLPWDRAAQQGWGVGLYRRDQDDSGPEAFTSSSSTDFDTLLQLVREALQPPMWRQ